MKFDKREFQAINRLINNTTKSGQNADFSKVWSKIILLIHTYIFFTIFFFIGIPGYPTGLWLAIEMCTEVIIVFDFALRFLTRKLAPKFWSEMYLLHDKGAHSNFHFTIRLIGSFP